MNDNFFCATEWEKTLISAAVHDARGSQNWFLIISASACCYWRKSSLHWRQENGPKMVECQFQHFLDARNKQHNQVIHFFIKKRAWKARQTISIWILHFRRVYCLHVQTCIEIASTAWNGFLAMLSHMRKHEKQSVDCWWNLLVYVLTRQVPNIDLSRHVQCTTPTTGLTFHVSAPAPFAAVGFVDSIIWLIM